VEDVVLHVHRDDAEDAVTVDEPDDRDESVDSAERECGKPRGCALRRQREQGDARRDVDEVVGAVDLEDADQLVAVDALAGVERGVEREAEQTDEQQRRPEDQAVPLRRRAHVIARMTAA
jgi:hypothetical protein